MPSKPGMRNRLKHTLPAIWPGFRGNVLDGRCRLAKEVHHRLQSLDVPTLAGRTICRITEHLVRALGVAGTRIGSEEARIGSGGE